MEKIDLERYIYKLIPDYAYIDYAEKEYWTKHATNYDYGIYSDNLYADSGSPWYNIHNIMYDTSATSNNVYKSIGYGRCLLVSPVELEFISHPDEVICQLKKYGDRYVYACFSSDDELFRDPHIQFRGKSEQIIDMITTNRYESDLPYVFELRF